MKLSKEYMDYIGGGVYSLPEDRANGLLNNIIQLIVTTHEQYDLYQTQQEQAQEQAAQAHAQQQQIAQAHAQQQQAHAQQQQQAHVQFTATPVSVTPVTVTPVTPLGGYQQPQPVQYVQQQQFFTPPVQQQQSFIPSSYSQYMMYGPASLVDIPVPYAVSPVPFVNLSAQGSGDHMHLRSPAFIEVTPPAAPRMNRTVTRRMTPSNM